MINKRAKKPAAMKIEELPRSPEELTTDQAEAIQGGVISLTSPLLSTSGVLSAAEPDKPEPKPPKVTFGLPIR